MVFRRIVHITLFCIVLQSCHSPSEVEEKAIGELNNQYTGYHFYSGKDISGAYLNVNVPSIEVDTVGLQKIYDVAIVRNDSVKWVYLNVFSSDRDYLFTIVKQGANFKYYKEANIS